MTALELADLLKTIIGANLGRYKRANGESFPAFIVLPMDAARPAEYQPTGLECVLREQPRRSPRGMLGGDVNYRNSWSFYLTQWPDAASPNTPQIEPAVLELQRYFLGDIRLEPVRTEVPAIAQYAALLKDWAYVDDLSD